MAECMVCGKPVGIVEEPLTYDPVVGALCHADAYRLLPEAFQRPPRHYLFAYKELQVATLTALEWLITRVKVVYVESVGRRYERVKASPMPANGLTLIESRGMPDVCWVQRIEKTR